jgi:alanine-alpha-ketoisovalerate/valine-pyruvate aminotransferase
MSTRKFALAAGLMGMSLIGGHSFFSQAQETGGSKEHQCVRTEYSSQTATLECKNSGTRCATVSEC